MPVTISTARLEARISTDLHSMLKRAAELQGRTMTDFVVSAVQDAAQRAQRIRELESIALKTNQTQLFIETPYRNTALLQALIQTLHPNTQLAISCGITLANAVSHSASISAWRQKPPPLPLALPAVFAIGA